VDFVCKLIGLIDIYNIIVKASLSVQRVNKYSWEYDDAIKNLEESLHAYAKSLEQVDLNKTQEMNSIEDKALFYISRYTLTSNRVCFLLECEQDALDTSYTISATTIDVEDFDNIEENEEQLTSLAPLTTLIEKHYQSLINCTFKDRPIIRHRVEYDLEDPTLYTRRKLIVLCQELANSTKTRFQETPQMYLLRKNCLDVSLLYEQVVLTGQQTLVSYGHSALQELLDFTIKQSGYERLDSNMIQVQYLEWKGRCLCEIADENTYNIWATDEKIITSKVMRTFFTNDELANSIKDFLYFYSLMILKVRSGAVCESAASILKHHIHMNRVLKHSSLDEEVMLHWNAPPLHLPDLFIKSSLNDYFNHMKDKQWLFYKKGEKHQVWKLISSGSTVLNRLRKVQISRLPEPCDAE